MGVVKEITENEMTNDTAEERQLSEDAAARIRELEAKLSDMEGLYNGALCMREAERKLREDVQAALAKSIEREQEIEKELEAKNRYISAMLCEGGYD